MVENERKNELGEREELMEALLDGWLQMSMSIWNERLVTAMTYNESLVCNLLYKQRKRSAAPLTATDLCSRLQIRKPQMNVILNGLEEKGIIARTRSKEDRRSVNIELTETGIPLYEKAHREILRFPEAIIAHFGEERMREFAATMKDVAACFEQVALASEEKG